MQGQKTEGNLVMKTEHSCFKLTRLVLKVTKVLGDMELLKCDFCLFVFPLQENCMHMCV